MNESLKDFRAKLESVRIDLSSGHSIFMISQLNGITTKEVVHDAVRPSVAPEHRPRIVGKVMEYGIRIFCILVLMDQIDQLTNFFLHDTTDSRLPINDHAKLQDCAPTLCVHCFTEIQWQFIPRFFERNFGHVILPKQTILAFIREEQRSEGSGGTVSVVEMLGSQRKSYNAVLKRIKARKTAASTTRIFDKEKDSLALYCTLRHPNIISLLGSFTLNGEHHLLFPYLEMDLEAFLKKQERFGRFSKNSTFTAALSDLASGLKSVHEANLRCKLSPEFLNIFGYHHDIRPANILVSTSTFLLADFGLASPGHASVATKPPMTKWVSNIGNYVAPECMDEHFEPRNVGRSYDIWAFGCLVSEVITYMQLGPVGIETFRKNRLSQNFHNEAYRNGYFFDGSSLKKGVTDWLQLVKDQAREGCDSVSPSLIDLSLGMLKIDPEERRDMLTWSFRLSFVHVKGLYCSAHGLMERMLSTLLGPGLPVHNQTITQLEVDIITFEAYGKVLGLGNETQLDSELFQTEHFSQFVRELLEAICSRLGSSNKKLTDYHRIWASSASNSDSNAEITLLNSSDISVRQELRKLTDALPPRYQICFNSLCVKGLEREGDWNDNALGNILQRVEDLSKVSPESYSNLGIHAKLLRLERALSQKTSSAAIGEQADLVLDFSQITITKTFSRNHNLGLFRDSAQPTTGNFDATEQQEVIIEWILPSQFPGGEPEEQRIGKLLSLATLLRSAKPQGFRVLDCLGFFPPRRDSHAGYGFVFPFPNAIPRSNDRMEPTTLRHLLDPKSPKNSISLGEKFRLAKKLARCVFEMHNHGWLHKNIRSENVVFFNISVSNPQSVRCQVGESPFLIGMHHSRRDDKAFYSDVPSADIEAELLLYQHPKYNSGVNRFDKTYDCYSLGVVLLEVAFWMPVQEMWERIGKRNGLRGEAFQAKLIEKWVPKLSEIMGEAYREATLACLNGGPGWNMEGNIDSEDKSPFYWGVVNQLDACYVG